MHKSKRSCEDTPDQETAIKVKCSESSPGNDTEVLNVNLVTNPSDDVSKVVI